MKRFGVSCNSSIPEIASIPVIDFILANTDRHTENWGWLMNNRTGVLSGVAPLFDFNCALVADYFSRDVSNTISQMFNDGSTLIGLAESHLQYSRVSLNKSRWTKLYSKEIDYRFILNNVYKRAEYLGVVR